MPWVIWDILVPMLATFVIGLGTGWLLWRWRRQKGGVAAATISQASSTSVQEVDDSVNTVLIEERDNAVARADAAQSELEVLKGQIDLSVMGGDSADLQAQNVVEEPEQQLSTEEVDALTRELEKEKAAKAEVERSLVDLNTRYKNLSVRLEDEISGDDADSLKEAAALESDFEKAKARIASQELELKQWQEKEQTAKQQHQQEIALRDAQLKQERAEREDVRMQLAREKLANENRVVSEKSGAIDNNVIARESGKVHQLSGYNSSQTEKGSGQTSYDPDTQSTASKTVNSLGGITQSPSESGLVKPSASVASAGLQQPSLDGAASLHGSVAVDHRVEEGLAPAEQDQMHIEDVHNDAVADEAVEDLKEEQTVQEKLSGVTARDNTLPGVEAQQQQNVTSINTATRKPIAKKKSTASGYVPAAWSVPEKAPLKSERDDLQEIKGVGPVLEKLLHKTGIYHFRQVALLDKKGVAELDSQLPQFSGRIQREKWVQQAKTLHRAKYGEAAK